MSEPDEKAPHQAVEGPEETLEPVREAAHQDSSELDALRARVNELEAAAGQSTARVSALEARERELTDRLARALADFDNFRRRARDESAQATARGKEAFVKTLLPALDTLERALGHTQDEGLRLLSKMFQSILADQGVAMLAPEGEAFDAKLHEAIGQEQREGVKAGTVLVVVEKGYALEGRVLRPARVIVAA